MKRTVALLAAFTLFASFTAYSQTSDAEADALINLLGIQKKEAIAKLVPVTGKDSIEFWKIYNDYSEANKITAKARLQVYERTARAYSNMTPQVADSLAGLYFVNRMEQEKMLETYYKKIKAATNAVVAFEFYQAEVYLLTQLRASIMIQIPLYGELQNSANRR